MIKITALSILFNLILLPLIFPLWPQHWVLLGKPELNTGVVHCRGQRSGPRFTEIERTYYGWIVDLYISDSCVYYNMKIHLTCVWGKATGLQDFECSQFMISTNQSAASRGFSSNESGPLSAEHGNIFIFRRISDTMGHCDMLELVLTAAAAWQVCIYQSRQRPPLLITQHLHFTIRSKYQIPVTIFHLAEIKGAFSFSHSNEIT